MTKIKICGLFRELHIEYANETSPDYVGFIMNYKKSHRSITLEQVEMFTKKLSNNIQTVGVFVNENMNEIIKSSEYLDVIQLHGTEDANYVENLRRLIPKKEIWKAFKIKSSDDFHIALNFSADMILLDNGYGTGEVFDWNILDVNKISRPFILAGGINLENVELAIKKFSPNILDISSSVETNKEKDLTKMYEIINKVRKGEKYE